MENLAENQKFEDQVNANETEEILGGGYVCISLNFSDEDNTDGVVF
jgi:hypothetical protein